MQLELSAPRRRKVISLTPLIDVVFILLLFFMLSSSFIHWRQLNLASSGSESEQELEVRHLQLQADGSQFELDGTWYSSRDAAALQNLIAGQPQAIWLIDAAEGTRTQPVISLLDALKQAGATHVTLAEGRP